jgi:prepilin-type N-terminal cleavage/methylation domain-containing protein
MRLSDKGFTLIELLLTFSILAFCLCGILFTYIQMFILVDLSRDLTLATNAVQAKMEDIKKTSFDSLLPLNATTFDISGFASSDAEGRVEVVSTAYSDLMRVRIVASFRSRNRVIGEDANLDGDLDTGEDMFITNSRLDSPVELVTLIAR